MKKDLDVGDGDMELKLTMWFQNPITGKKVAHSTWTHYDLSLEDPHVRDTTVRDYDPAIWILHHDSPIRDGWPAFVKAVEMDPAWALNADDELGTRDLNPRDNGQVMTFWHQDSLAMELTLAWDDGRHPDDDDETQDR